MSDTEDGVFDDWEEAADAGEFDAPEQELEVSVDPHSKEGIERAKQLRQDPSLQWQEKTGIADDFKPQLRLMKRPKDKTATQAPVQADRAATDKDLQRREREYAKARAEILGKDTKPSKQSLAKRK
eukprot:TRINITY_DN11416_c3_g3_i1.p1 TRINITY_DN11416_c3_g3~~TRINITY_DN11416_c3_g3_i1.p1  ORF type:complete len:126 (+),score=29.09 TRINITY_DN11416_c3_g3_i1:230-607(+)